MLCSRGRWVSVMPQRDATMEERTTAELIETLGDDVDRCFRGMDGSFKRGKKNPDGTINAKYEYHARQLIRAIFAFIEAVTFSMKLHAADQYITSGGELTDAERLFVLETEYYLKENGETGERPARIRLTDNIRFAFALQEKSLDLKEKFNANVDWWASLRLSIRVRDRLTHPKWPEHVDVAPDEVITALKAFNGFKEQAMRYADIRDQALTGSTALLQKKKHPKRRSKA